MRITTEVTLGCPLCGSADSQFHRNCRDHRGFVQGDFRYARCRQCSLVFLRHRPAMSEMAKCYPESYAPYDARRTTEHSRSASATARVVTAAVRQVRKHFPDPCVALLEEAYGRSGDDRVLLDFGCGSSAFLDTARGSGWKTIGVDFNEAVVRRVRAAGHAAYLVDDPTWEDEYSGSVAVVRMNHVLEHLESPVRSLRALRQVLRPDGVLHGAVPNLAGLSSRVFRGSWFGSEPRHLILFTPETLEQAVRAAGFRSVRLGGETAAKDLTRSARIGLGQQLGIEEPGSIFLMITELLHPLARIATALGAPDRLHVLARS